MNNQFELDSLIKKMAADHQPELPSPGLIWWRAEIMRKQQQKDLAERPFLIMRLVAFVACVAVFLTFMAGCWRQLQIILHGSSSVLMPLGMVTLAVTLLSVFLLLGLRSSKV